MPLLDCTHKSTGTELQVCVHLLAKPEDDYVKVFTGQGRTYLLACSVCRKEEIDSIPWRSVCDACFAEIEEEGYWDGIRDTPEVLEEPSNLAFVHRYVPGIASLRLVQPVPDLPGSIWVGLTEAGSLLEIDTDANTHRLIASVVPTDIDLAKPCTLICSADGRFLCLAETLGNIGVVIERASGDRTMSLARGSYRSNLSPFPIAFFVHAGRTLLIHGTNWNRLDISDPSTGELLTERSPTSYKTGEQRPPHYLDYFHSRLFISPDQEFVADDGWIWGPSGEVRTWSLTLWLTMNLWESEDGPSRRRLAQRIAFWGGPICWIDNQTLAIWGYGDEDDWLLPAVRLFDAVSGEETGWFPGPEVAPPKNEIGLRHLDDFGGRLFFDRYLFAVSTQHGMSVWNVERGTRLHMDSSFAPIAYHPAAKEFLTIQEESTLQLSRLVEME